MVSLLAIVCARNEAVHIGRCIRDLIAGGCDVILIDHASTDGTYLKAVPFLGKGLLRIIDLPWRGAFSLKQQLAAKREVVERATHDWIVHVDADEWLVSPEPGETLAVAISRGDASGYNVVNFNECAFVPLPGEDFNQPDYAARMRTYYFFQPWYPRLNRAFRRDAGLENEWSGGHEVKGDNVRRSPRDLILRHYIALSQEHARKKYVGRKFASEDVEAGWHANRLIINSDNINLRTHPALRQLPEPDAHNEFDLSAPIAEHFWQWPTQS